MASLRDGEDAVTHGTGNVFEDLGCPDAAERQAKLRLAVTLNQIVERRKLTQAEAAKLLGITQRSGAERSHVTDAARPAGSPTRSAESRPASR